MTADHRPVGRGSIGAVAVAGVLALAGCSGPSTPSTGSSPIGGGAGGTPSGTAASPAPRAAKPAATAKPTPPAADCPVGRWRLRSTEPTTGGSVENVSFSGRNAFDLRFDDGGRWRLVGDTDAPLTATIELAGYPVSGTATIDGTARGRYRMTKSVAVFRLERTSGEVVVSFPGHRQTYGMAAITGALVPDGAADLRCRGNTLTIEAENLTLDLRRVPG